MRSLTCAPMWIAAVIAALASCSSKSSAESGRGILVIAIDGLRYDHLGVAGYDRPTSPAFDQLAGEGVFFRQTFAAAPWQVPAHMALLSGADPRLAHRNLSPKIPASQAALWHYSEGAPHPAAEFLSNGFSTAVFYDHANLSPVYGYQRGFELYQGPSPDDNPASPYLGSEAVIRRFVQWLSRSPQDKRWFAYLELADLERVWSENDPRWDTFFPPRPELSRVPPVGDAPHVFFALPRSRWYGGMSTLGEYEARYDGAIAQLDAAFGRLRTLMERMGRFENTTIVVVGAYGMSFGESGLLLDSGTFADVDLHVPLIVRAARGIAMKAGMQSNDLISTVDLMPTLLGISDLHSTNGMDGQSFAPSFVEPNPKGRTELQASCGLQDGFATLDRQFCFERTWPGRVQDRRLRSSWFGDSEPRPDVIREVLHDRKHDPSLGHVTAPTADSEVARTLAQHGEAWAAAIEARRAVLQDERPVPAVAEAKPSGGK